MSFDPFTSAPNTLDKVVIDGALSPGLCDIEGVDSPRTWDELAGMGVAGSTLLFTGAKLSHFTLNFRLFTTQDFADWYAFQSAIGKIPFRRGAQAAAADAADTKGAVVKGMSIIHPLINAAGITSVVVENVVAPKLSDETGMWVASLRLIQYRAPTFGLGKVDGAEATPFDPVDAEIEKKRLVFEQTKALAGS